MGGSWSRVGSAVLLAGILVGCRIDHGLEPRQSAWSGIEGSVIFLGDWLEELEEIRVAVYRSYPPADSSDFFRIAGFSDPITVGVPRAAYQVPLTEGVYEWVVVAGRRAGLGWVEGYVFLGQFSRVPGDPVPSPVTVHENLATRNVDITVDFSDLPEPPIPEGKRFPLLMR